jgi:predicted ABC-class ATPase
MKVEIAGHLLPIAAHPFVREAASGGLRAALRLQRHIPPKVKQMLI